MVSDVFFEQIESVMVVIALSFQPHHNGIRYGEQALCQFRFVNMYLFSQLKKNSKQVYVIIKLKEKNWSNQWRRDKACGS